MTRLNVRSNTGLDQFSNAIISRFWRPKKKLFASEMSLPQVLKAGVCHENPQFKVIYIHSFESLGFVCGQF